jgi:hypothetical protein
MFNSRLLLFSVQGSCIQSKNIPNKPISSTSYWMERWDCPAVHLKMKLGEASGSSLFWCCSLACHNLINESFYRESLPC